jgi:hypothetical protein
LNLIKNTFLSEFHYFATVFEISLIRVYPEQREASHPTTGKILDRFDNISTINISATLSKPRLILIMFAISNIKRYNPKHAINGILSILKWR